MDMHTVTAHEGYSSIRDTLSHSGLSYDQAQALERAMANIKDFVPSYWLHEFMHAGFTDEQASFLVDLFVRRASS